MPDKLCCDHRLYGCDYTQYTEIFSHHCNMLLLQGSVKTFQLLFSFFALKKISQIHQIRCTHYTIWKSWHITHYKILLRWLCQRECLTWSPVADHHLHFSDMLASMLAAFCTHLVLSKTEATSLQRFSFSLRLWHVLDTLYRQPCYYKLSRSSFLRLHNPMYWLLWKYWLNHVAIIIPIQIGEAPVCLRADLEGQDSICEHLTLPANPCQISEPIEVLDKILAPILGRGKLGLNRLKFL